jgi:exopolysaccharide production protein ExoQ
MSFSEAMIVCMTGITGLFYLDRNKFLRTSKALWLPIIWLWIVGSRPASAWLSIWFGFHFGLPGRSAQEQIEGSPVDALIFAILLAAGIVVLSRRSTQTKSLLKANLPILIFFAFCLVSILWSPFPGVSFKRWIKAIGDLVMALIVVTEPDPIAALRRLFSRIGFILLPFSILLIKYSDLGRGYTPDGDPMNTGVTTNKNTLGLITYVVSVGAVWSFLQVLRAKRQPGYARQLIANAALVAFGVTVLAMAHSATSIACFGLGTALILLTGMSSIRKSPGAVHALVFTILFVGGIMMLFGGEGAAVHALGRKTNFTGRADIWKAVIPACPNPVIGAGFEGFWIGPAVNEVYRKLSVYMHVNEAHDGYIEIYLNLGCVGLCLIAWILISGYRSAAATFRYNAEIGRLMLAYVATSAIYSVTEAGFRMLTPSWIFLLLALVASSGTAAGLAKRRIPRVRGLPYGRDGDLPDSSDLNLTLHGRSN